MRQTMLKMACAFAFVLGSAGATHADAIEGGERWREWFARRQFGEDPYFFFPSGTAGPTGCPENRRLSYAGADSTGLQLSVIDERVATPQVRARCTVRFEELQGVPEVRELPDGRAMWALRAAAVR